MTRQIHYIETALQKCEEMTRYVAKWRGILDVEEVGRAVVQMQDHVEELIGHVEENLEWYKKRERRKHMHREWRKRRRQAGKYER
jgi:hypothetical protein